MRLGISESRTHEILLEEMGKIGLQGSDGLVLFGGGSLASPCLGHGQLKWGRERCFTSW